jgi:hypothetical protein
MLYGQALSKPISTTEAVLNWIKDSRFVLYPTGSRYFGNVTETSDWDFFAQNCTKLQHALEEAGFNLETESYQGDPIMVQVWKKADVHVQLVSNARHKQRIQWVLRPLIICLKPSKEDAKRLWSMATKLYLDGYNEGVRDCTANQKGIKRYDT